MRIAIEPDGAGSLAIEFPYSEERVAKIKTIVGRRWDAVKRHWLVPHSADALTRLLEIFAEDRVELAPSLMGSGRPSPVDRAGYAPLLERLRDALRGRRCSLATEKHYVAWAERFLRAQGGAPAQGLFEDSVARFLSALGNKASVSASTQNQALAALAFLFKHVLGGQAPFSPLVPRAKRPKILPTVLARGEVAVLLGCLHGTPRLMATLIYGAGLRLLECCRLRVKDIDWPRSRILVRSERRKERFTLLPVATREPLEQQLLQVRRQHDEDTRRGEGSVCLPGTLDPSHPTTSRELGWQWVFPAPRHYLDRQTGHRRRYHLHATVFPRGRLRHPHRAKAARPRRRGHDDGLLESSRRRGSPRCKPGRRAQLAGIAGEPRATQPQPAAHRGFPTGRPLNSARSRAKISAISVSLTVLH